MRLQQQISSEVQEAKVGETLRVIFDRAEGDYLVGRTQYDSPEVDPEVLVKLADAKDAAVGHFSEVRIDNADDFDLYGHCV